jgi:sigma-B regulation protein RsbU (phosphoserine phosphatase)
VTSRRRTENALRQKTALLGSISAAQSGFILSGLLHESLSRLLEDILLLTESAFGFIGELSFDPSGLARLDIHAAMDCALDGEGRRACSLRPSGVVALKDMGALCGRPALSGRPVVFNGAGHEEAAGFLPGGNPPLTSFLGLPFLIGDEVVGMVGVSNRPEGYTQEMAAQLESFVTTCASLIGAHRGEQRRKAAENALRESDERAHTVLNTIVEGIITVNEQFVVEVANPAAAHMFGYLPEEMAGISVFTLMPELRKRTEEGGARKRLCPGSPDCSGVNRKIAAAAADGRDFFVELSMNETTAPDGGSLFTVSIRDITERLHTEAQLLEARAREASMRTRIQETLLFGHPPSTLRGVTVGMATLPSDEMDGDFFDFFELAPGTMDLLVGDIMGKGTTAALLGAATKNHFLRAINLLNSESGGRVPGPADILNQVNRAATPQLMRPGIEVFATLFYARFELESRHCVFVDCGHTKTIHCHADGGACTELSGENLPLGILLEETYSDRRVPYDPGDVFVLYSDGITEAHDDAGRYFGVEGIWSALDRCRFRDSGEIVDALMKSVLEHSGTVGFSDDATCLVVKADALKTLEERVPARLDNLTELRSLLRGFLSEAGCAVSSGEAVDKMELGLVEAFTNIVKHAYGGEKGGQVLVRMELLPGGVCLRLEHDGPFFAPQKVAAPAVEELPENGYGLFLISQCFDTVDYFVTAGGRSAVILAARFGAGRGAPPE